MHYRGGRCWSARQHLPLPVACLFYYLLGRSSSKTSPPFSILGTISSLSISGLQGSCLRVFWPYVGVVCLMGFFPYIFSFYNSTSGETMNVPLWSFIIIAAGGVGCLWVDIFLKKRAVVVLRSLHYLHQDCAAFVHLLSFIYRLYYLSLQ